MSLDAERARRATDGPPTVGRAVWVDERRLVACLLRVGRDHMAGAHVTWESLRDLALRLAEGDGDGRLPGEDGYQPPYVDPMPPIVPL